MDHEKDIIDTDPDDLDVEKLPDIPDDEDRANDPIEAPPED